MASGSLSSLEEVMEDITQIRTAIKTSFNSK